MQDPTSETTVVEAMAALRSVGYSADFSVTRDGQLACGACGHTHAPSEAAVDALTRIEGITDPGDEAAVFGLACRECGGRGLLVTAFGPAASAEEAAVLTALLDRRQD